MKTTLQNYFEGPLLGFRSCSVSVCLTWRSSRSFFTAGFLSSLRAAAHPRTSSLSAFEWKTSLTGGTKCLDGCLEKKAQNVLSAELQRRL